MLLALTLIPGSNRCGSERGGGEGLQRDSWAMGICGAFMTRRKIRSVLTCCSALILYNKEAKKITNNEQIKGIDLEKNQI